MKYLGVTITGDLKWSSHCYNVSRPATRTLRRTLYGCSREVKKTALVRCAPVWSPHTEKDRHLLERVQKRAAHWVWNPATFSWSNTYLFELNWVSVTKRHEALSLCQAYKIVNSLNFTNYFTLPNRPSRHCMLRCVHSRIKALLFYQITGINYQKRSPVLPRTYHSNIN